MIKRVLVALAIIFIYSCTQVQSYEPTPIRPIAAEEFKPVEATPYLAPSLIPTAASTPEPTTKPTPKPVLKAHIQSKPRSVSRGIPYGKSVSGSATYCAPTPKYCHGWDRSYVAAIGNFHWGDKPYKVQVCSKNTGKCVIVTVISFCACGKSNGIDLSVPAFKAIDGLWRGRINVTVRRVR